MLDRISSIEDEIDRLQARPEHGRTARSWLTFLYAVTAGYFYIAFIWLDTDLWLAAAEFVGAILLLGIAIHRTRAYLEQRKRLRELEAKRDAVLE